MNINLFFFLILSVLVMILFLFKPLNIKQQEFKDVPLFNISSFTVYELNNKGLITFINGSQATRYSDRYTINDIDYTDNSKKFLANMKADYGVFKDKIVDLKGDVVYFREDGLTFETKEATYNKEASIARADSDFILFRDKNKATGTNLVYSNLDNKIDAKNIKITYQIQKSQK
jgi:LPS export ABC transporter protein LptC